MLQPDFFYGIIPLLGNYNYGRKAMADEETTTEEQDKANRMIDRLSDKGKMRFANREETKQKLAEAYGNAIYDVTLAAVTRPTPLMENLGEKPRTSAKTLEYLSQLDKEKIDDVIKFVNPGKIDDKETDKEQKKDTPQQPTGPKQLYQVEYIKRGDKMSAKQECFDNLDRNIPISYDLKTIDNGDGTYRIAAENIQTTADVQSLVQAAEEYYIKNNIELPKSATNLIEGYIDARIKSGITAREAESKASGLESIYAHQGQNESYSWEHVTGRKTIDGKEVKFHDANLSEEERKALKDDAIEARKRFGALAKIEDIKKQLTPPVENVLPPEEFLDKPKKPRRKKILGLAIGKRIKDTGMGV